MAWKPISRSQSFSDEDLRPTKEAKPNPNLLFGLGPISTKSSRATYNPPTLASHAMSILVAQTDNWSRPLKSTGHRYTRLSYVIELIQLVHYMLDGKTSSLPQSAYVVIMLDLIEMLRRISGMSLDVKTLDGQRVETLEQVKWALSPQRPRPDCILRLVHAMDPKSYRSRKVIGPQH